MAEPLYFIKKADIDKLAALAQTITLGAETLSLRGILLSPGIEGDDTPIHFLNAVYGNDQSGDKDIIIQTNDSKTCPYPPGYGVTI